MEEFPSGSGFLQELGQHFDLSPKRSNYYGSLCGDRRVTLLQEVCYGVVRAVRGSGLDLPSPLPELSRYVCLAVDMHWHMANTHAKRNNLEKALVGHTFSLNLRDYILRHLVAERMHEHNLHIAEGRKPKGLRQAVPKRKRVLTLYDRTRIDIEFWKRCPHENTVYFVSRPKSNKIFDWADERPWDPADSQNRVVRRKGRRSRLIKHHDQENGKECLCLTKESELLPGAADELVGADGSYCWTCDFEGATTRKGGHQVQREVDSLASRDTPTPTHRSGHCTTENSPYAISRPCKIA